MSILFFLRFILDIILVLFQKFYWFLINLHLSWNHQFFIVYIIKCFLLSFQVYIHHPLLVNRKYFFNFNLKSKITFSIQSSFFTFQCSLEKSSFQQDLFLFALIDLLLHLHNQHFNLTFQTLFIHSIQLMFLWISPSEIIVQFK